MLYPKIETLFKRGDDHRLTDELRRPVFGTISEWVMTEKVDGTNIRIRYDRDPDGEVAYLIGGRTENAQIPAPLIDHIRGLDHDAVTEIMNRHEIDRLTLFGEGYGPKIQGGGDYRDDQGFIVFDMLANDRFWLTDAAVTANAEEIGIPRVPILGHADLRSIINLVRDGFESRCAARVRLAEGIVARPVEPLFDARGERLILKLKTKDFS